MVMSILQRRYVEVNKVKSISDRRHGDFVLTETDHRDFFDVSSDLVYWQWSHISRSSSLPTQRCLRYAPGRVPCSSGNHLSALMNNVVRDGIAYKDKALNWMCANLLTSKHGTDC